MTRRARVIVTLGRTVRSTPDRLYFVSGVPSQYS